MEATGLVPKFMPRFAAAGINLPSELFTTRSGRL
jgi:hypothetical protein